MIYMIRGLISVPEKTGLFPPRRCPESPYPVVVDYKVLLYSCCSGFHFMNHSSSTVAVLSFIS